MKIEKLGILEAIGNTPFVQLVHLDINPAVKIYAKLEGNNPGGSIKDRPAYYMIKKAEESGVLAPGQTIVEPTSGNTGIAIAMIAAAQSVR
jgi:cysteine synthase B